MGPNPNRALNGALLCPISDFATRQCSGNGLWLDDDGKEGPDPSWTNFSACFTPELTKVIEGFYANISGMLLVLYILMRCTASLCGISGVVSVTL